MDAIIEKWPGTTTPEQALRMGRFADLQRRYYEAIEARLAELVGTGISPAELRIETYRGFPERTLIMHGDRQLGEFSIGYAAPYGSRLQLRRPGP